MKTYPTTSRRRGRLALFAALMLAPLGVEAADHVTNGSFDTVLTGWTKPEAATGSIYVHDGPGGHVDLHTDSFGYLGQVLRQNLNIPGIASTSVEASADFRMELAEPGHTIAVYLEYTLTDGSVTRHKILNPDNLSIEHATDFTTVSDTFTFPGDADRLIGLSIEKEARGRVLADNFTLLSLLAANPLPEITSISPTRLAYGDTLTITGTNFGVTQGTLFLNQSVTGVTVNSWTDTSIVATIDDPAASGYLLLLREDWVRANQQRHVGITSPHFTMTRFMVPNDFGNPEAEMPIAIPGQTVHIHVDIDCFNGCAPPGGITFVPPASTSSTANPLNVAGDGGTRIGIDTTGLPAGLHTFTIGAIATGFAPRDFQITIDIRDPGAVQLQYLDPVTFAWVDAPNPWPITSQEGLPVNFVIRDLAGNDISTSVPLGLGTDNPAVAETYVPSTPWDSTMVLPQDNGSCTISIYGPLGRKWDFPVTVTVPADPKITTFDLLPSAIDNSGTSTATRTVSTSRPMNTHNGNISSHEIRTINSEWSNGNSTLTMTIRAEEGAAPGSYLMTSTAGLAGGGQAIRSRVINVINDPATGMIIGHLSLMRDPFHSHGANGTVEFYDAATGDKMFERLVFEFSWRYQIGSIPPGTYKIRWSTGEAPGYPAPQWYGNAYSFADATPVTITASSVTPGLNFFLDLLPDTITPLAGFEGSDLDPANDVFQMQFPIEDGFSYDFQKSLSGEEGSWFTIGSLSGNTTTATFTDENAVEEGALYRVSRR